MRVQRLSLPALLSVTALGALALLGTSSSSAVTGCDRYASPTGSDGAAGSEASPFATAQKLADSLVAGQTGCLRGGTYDPGSMYALKVMRGGTSSAPLTVRSYPGETAKLVGITYVPRGSNFVKLSRLKIEGHGTQNTLQINASDTILESSDITNLRRGKSCVMLGDNSSYGPAVRTIVRRNVFHDCGDPSTGNQDHSIYAANASDGQIVDNVFYNQSGYSLHLYPNSRNMLVAHNVIDGGGSIRGGAIFGSDSSYASNDNIVEKNVITHAATYGIDAWWGGTTGTGNIARNNCLFANKLGDVVSPKGFTASANTVTDPLFVNRTARDYRLGAASGCLSVVGYDTAALIASGGATPPPPPSGDTTAPVASWSTPLTGGTVQGLLNEVSANCLVSASDDVAVTQVD
ncbi:MAG: right-handed parallel beta-helix repeat-containing protein, partial [Solirubrobacteraceae bacterium]